MLARLPDGSKLIVFILDTPGGESPTAVTLECALCTSRPQGGGFPFSSPLKMLDDTCRRRSALSYIRFVLLPWSKY